MKLRLTAVEVDGRAVYDAEGVDALMAHRLGALQDGINVALQQLTDQVNAAIGTRQVSHGESPKVQTVIRDGAGRITKLVSMPAEIVR